MKKIILVLFVVFISGILSAQTITTSAPLQTSLCAGGNVVVQYTTDGNFGFFCNFTAQLSDMWGNFSNPVNIGTVPINLGMIYGTIPANTPFGFNYRVRVVSDNPSVTGSVSPLPPIVIASVAISATIIPTPSTEVCEGNNINLWVVSNAEYHWSTGDTTQSIEVDESGIYTVTVTNYVTGCEVTAPPVQITIDPLPNVNLGTDLSLCQGETTVLDAGSGYVFYSWNNGMAHTQTINVQNTGEYFVRVRDDNGCENRDTVQVDFHPHPLVDLGNDTVLCSNDLQLDAGPGYESYNWNDGLSFNPSLLVSESGQYYVDVSNSFNCHSFDTIDITLYPLPFVMLGNDLSACGASNLTLNAGNGFAAYDWNDGAGSGQYFTIYSSGDYHVLATDSNGCQATDTINVLLNDLPVVDLGPDLFILTSDSVVLHAGFGYASYLWSTGSTDSIFVIHGSDYLPGTYSFFVTATDQNGCSNSGQVSLTIGGVSVPENTLQHISVFPNPTTGVVHVLGLKGNYVITFYDIRGREVSRFTNTNKLDLKGFEKGVYVMKIQTETGSLIKKLVLD